MGGPEGEPSDRSEDSRIFAKGDSPLLISPSCRFPLHARPRSARGSPSGEDKDRRTWSDTCSSWQQTSPTFAAT